jgi:hypothetical protein
MGTFQTIAWVVTIVLLLWAAYFVYQTYVWFGKLVALGGAPPDDTGQLRDYIEQANDLVKSFFQLLKQH